MIKLLDFSEIKKDFESYRINKHFKHDIIKDINYMQMSLLKDFINNKENISNYTLYYKRNYTYICELIEKSLYFLCDRKLIIYNPNCIVIDANDEYKEITDSDESKIILKCKRMALEELNLDSIVELYDDENMLKKYYDIINNLVKEKLNYKCVYDVYDIICNTEYLDEGLEENLISLALDLDIFNERND